jgi:hypothetical protein|tara:strand:- start:975 stop:1166 length:192 start_codon:yes stop_codon:yes gene_type:complete
LYGRAICSITIRVVNVIAVGYMKILKETILIKPIATILPAIIRHCVSIATWRRAEWVYLFSIT